MLLFFFLSFINVALCTKKWIPNTNFDNTLNWSPQELPKHCDALSFPTTLEAPAFWNIDQVSLASIKLPRTGSIVFRKEGMSLLMQADGCKDQDKLYMEKKRSQWLNPLNWETIDEEKGWKPHLENLPCAGEDVVFPSESGFAVTLPKIRVPIGKVQFRGTTLNGEEWTRFLDSTLGQMYFYNPDTSVSKPWVSGGGCLKPNECECISGLYHSEKLLHSPKTQDLIKTVCALVKPRCEGEELPRCSSPILPKGHCCGVCGSLILIKTKTGNEFQLKDVKNIVFESLVSEGKENSIKPHISRVQDAIQIVAIDSGDDSINSFTFSRTLKTKLKNINQQAEISIEVSGQFHSQSRLKSGVVFVFGTLLASVVFFAAVFYLFLVISPTINFESSRAFMFARFENKSNSEENLVIVKEEAEPIPRSFDNPLYKDVASSSKAGKEENDEGATEMLKMSGSIQELKTLDSPHVTVSNESETEELVQDEPEMKTEEDNILETEHSIVSGNKNDSE